MKKKKFFTLITIAFCVLTAQAQSNKVYYYERVKTVKDGQQQRASGDGHYLSINSHGLYECNKNGSSMSKGFVKYVNSNNNRPYYEGDAYLGRGLMYVFNSDYTRLNLHLGNGTIYVYTRKASPTSMSALRSYKSESSTALPAANIQIPSTNSNTSTNTSRTQPKVMTCPHCNGSGRKLITTNGALSRNQYWVTCGECGQRHLNTTGHTHVSCSYCNGTGRKRL